MTELLVIKPSSLGDIVQALRVATSLKAQVPGLRVSWVVRDLFAPIVRSSEAVDQVYVFERTGGTKSFLKLMKEIRATKFDYVFDMQGLLRTGIMTSRTRAKRKVGRSDAREWAGVFYDERVPLPPDGRRSHATDILLQFCPVLGAKAELRGPLRFREVDSLNLKFADGRGGAKPFVMFPDSRRADKKWGGFKQLTEMILREGQGPQGGLGRQQLPARPRRLPRDPVPQPDRQHEPGLAAGPREAGPTGWSATTAARCTWRPAVGVKVFAIFGPTDPRLYGPYPIGGPHNHVIQAPVGDLKLLSVRDVYARFQKIRSR